ncbi:MAG TPA: hypothetical protein VFU23_01775, partial [Gemmatimonadales bacterium]|nr:hypothetical protein [Gemmatimonadales bacterium]
MTTGVLRTTAGWNELEVTAGRTVATGGGGGGGGGRNGAGKATVAGFISGGFISVMAWFPRKRRFGSNGKRQTAIGTWKRNVGLWAGSFVGGAGSSRRVQFPSWACTVSSAGP